MGLLSERSSGEELMDDLDCNGTVVDQTLHELDVINKWLGGNHVTINGIKKLVKSQLNPLTVIDLGCGSGEMLKLIATWANKNHIDIKLIGIDANPNIIAYAEESCKDYPQISFKVLDIFSEEFKAMKCDIITATLFTHHFTSDDLKNLLSQWMKMSKLGVVINDIHRHWLAYRSIKLLTSLFSNSDMVKFDAPLSVQRAFRKNELTEIMSHSKLTNYDIKWMWAFRWQIVCRNPINS